MHCPVYPTSGYSDYPNSLSFLCFFVALVQLVVAVIWTLQIYSISVFSLRLDISTVDWHLVSTVHWTSRLDGALDVSDIAWTLSKGSKESYKYDLANSLVPLIALSLDHQNHSKCPKWGHVRYTTDLTKCLKICF